MASWRKLYGELAGPQYPHLVAYAQLLTGDRTRADALVEHALRRTFGRLRRLGSDDEVATEIRRVIVARFLATAGEHSSRAVQVAAAVPSNPARQPDVDPALYAPPGASHTGPADQPGPKPAVPGAELHRGVVPETDRTHAALATLSPQARAITVLRHYDNLAPHRIASQLGLDPRDVVEQLRDSHAALRGQLRITIPDEPDLGPSDSPDGATHVVVAPHAGSR